MRLETESLIVDETDITVLGEGGIWVTHEVFPNVSIWISPVGIRFFPKEEEWRQPVEPVVENRPAGFTIDLGAIEDMCIKVKGEEDNTI